jgi:hypothetical protein
VTNGDAPNREPGINPAFPICLFYRAVTWYNTGMTKTKAEDFRVPNAAEAMRKTGEAIKSAFAIPKARIDAMLAKERAEKKRRNRR